MVTFNNDIDVLNYALGLEDFEAALYKVLIGTNLLTGTEAQYLTTFGMQEQTHADTLRSTISQRGGTPVPVRTSYNFAAAGPITTRDQLVAVLAMVEDVGASAYLGAAGFLQDKGLLTAALTIHAVEGEHASIFRDMAGMVAAPDAVAKGRTPDEVIAIVTPFLQTPASGGSTSTGSPSTSPPTGAQGPAGSGTGNSSPGGGGAGSAAGTSGTTGSGSGTSSNGATGGGNPSGSSPTTSTAGQTNGPRPNFIRRLGDG
ncbi:MAG: ferritin-like domain-containing protein [Thermomicrobiales bacterium]